MTDYKKLIGLYEVLSEHFELYFYSPSPAYVEAGMWRFWFNTSGELILVRKKGQSGSFETIPEMQEWVKRFYPNHTYENIAEKIGASTSVINTMIQNLLETGQIEARESLPRELTHLITSERWSDGKKVHYHWTDTKNRYLMERFYSEGVEACAKRLHTTESAVRTQASRLGITG